jgi:ribonuclease P protein component
MVFARAWRPRAAARFSRRGARTGASGSVRDRARSVVVERLRRRSDFRAAARGERASGRAFVLQARARGDEGAVRVGFTVSRQVGNSVERNRVRRRLREVVRVSAAAAAGQLCPGHDYVLIGRRAALAAPFGEMMRELDAALARIHALESLEPGGTGSARADPLHEAGSPPLPQKQREGRRKPLQSPPKPPGHKPQER